MSSPTCYTSGLCNTNEPVLSTSGTLKVGEANKKRQALISKLFPSSKRRENSENDIKPSTSSSSALQSEVNVSYEKTINSVKVVLPVKPYKCQIAVMSKVITAIKESENRLLESPTGTGKTLALLCAALAWQQQEKKRLIKLQEDEAYSRNPILKDLQNSTAAGIAGTAADIAGPQKNISEISEIQFVKPIHGAKSIYDVPIEECNFSYAKKRKEMLDDSNESDGLVGISKKVRTSEVSNTLHSNIHDAEKQKPGTDKDVTQDGTNNQEMLDNLQEQVSMIVDCSLPVIYYGTRTHKQLEQVVQEFARTEYAKASPMTILSSRDYSCIRDFDKTLWASRSDMCQGCTKSSTSTNSESNCQYYTNYKELKHGTLPPAFDLKKLISEGRRITACPYYAAKRMGSVAQIVFCPYNYLIEPTIRKNMQIDLDKNIVIIDEGHNIEDVCREAASFTFKQAEIEHALKELQTASNFRFANKDALDYIAYLNMALEEWSSWFTNQKPLIERQPVMEMTAEYVWEVENFVETLDNHNIGLKKYPDFSKNAKIFCKKVRDDVRQLVGITQATAVLIENLDTVFGYLFRNSGQCMEDYTPVLIRKLRSPVTGHASKSRFNETARTESLSLGLLCLNPGVVFSGLGVARCVLLASGTLTPMSSLLSELDTSFAYTPSPGHVLQKDRVWVGSVRGWQYDSQVAGSPDAQDHLGRLLQRVCDVTPHGVLCFLPSYRLMNILYRRWCTTNLWEKLCKIKEVFMESNSIEDHEKIMKHYYRCVCNPRGALLLAVYRGKVAEGMDFKDHQARAVIAVGVPYPSQHTAVKEKMRYNDKYAKIKKLLNGREWFKVQAYRALNQAVGRVVRHAHDWGAVLLVDRRYSQPQNRQHLAKWVQERLGKNHYDYDTLLVGENNLEEFMTRMKTEE